MPAYRCKRSTNEIVKENQGLWDAVMGNRWNSGRAAVKIPRYLGVGWSFTAIGKGIAWIPSMKRVLLVEDSADVRLVLQLELEWLGYTVNVATDAKAGLKIALLSRPDVIVSDLGLPEEDGFDFIKRVRRIKELATVPAIVLTGFGAPDVVTQALAAGFNAHLTKPADPNELSDLIEKLTAKRLGRKAS